MAKNAQKVVLLGDSGVGKSALVRRFLYNEFTGRESKTAPTLESTSGNLAAEKKIRIGDECVVLSIWDTAGEERFRALQRIYYSNAKGAVLVYDLTDAEASFEKVRMWVKALRQLDTHVHICICGNKADLASRKGNLPCTNEYEEFAKSYQATHHITSAKQGTGVTNAFITLAGHILHSLSSSVAPRKMAHSSSRKQSGRSGLHIEEDETTRLNPEYGSPSGSSCCCVVS